MNKQQLQQELNDVKEIYIVPINRRFTKFNVYYLKDGQLKLFWIDPEEKSAPVYWVPLHYTKNKNYIGGYFNVAVWGSNRYFEISYSIGVWLFNDGYRLKGVPLV